MTAPIVLSDLIFHSAERAPEAPALSFRQERLSYAELAEQIQKAAHGLLELGLGRNERVAVYLPKRLETVIALFAIARAGGVFVPVNPLLKPEQVAYILKDCNVRVLITANDRANLLAPVLAECHDLHTVVTLDEDAIPGLPTRSVVWESLLKAPAHGVHRCIDTDMAAILYTSGSTGKPKGVVLSHRNMIVGAQSVASYLGNGPHDRILAVLPLSFDAGFSQLTTAFWSGASAVVMDYLLPRDVIRTAARETVTGLTAVPPLWVQLAQLEWPPEVVDPLPKVGPDLEIDVEKVAALEPDLVLATLTVPGHEAVVERLEAAGLPYVAPEPTCLADVYRDIRDLAERLGVPEQAEPLVQSMRAELGDGRRSPWDVGDPPPEPDPRPAILVQWWPKPVITPGAQSWATDGNGASAISAAHPACIIVRFEMFMDYPPLSFPTTGRIPQDSRPAQPRGHYIPTQALQGKFHCAPWYSVNAP